MNLSEYPRPQNDLGIGFSYFPDNNHFNQRDLDCWLPRLRELGASWLVLQTPVARPVPDSFLQQLMMGDVEPVVVLTAERVGPLDLPSLTDTVHALADSGAHYVVLGDQPNSRSRWTPQEWAKPAVVERFVDYMVPALETVAAEGLFPVLPPLDPFGAYWDTSFLQTMLASLVRRGLGPLLERASIGMRNFANHRPLDWGVGGRKAWPQCRPYACDDGTQDHRGFRLFEWYLEIVRESVGRELPIIACANGPQDSRGDDDRPLDQRKHADQSVEMVNLLANGELPPAVLNHAFWVLSAERSQAGYAERWFDPNGKPRLLAVQAVQNAAAELRLRPAASQDAYRQVVAGRVTEDDQGVGPAGGVTSHSKGKLIQHYLLLPVFEWGVEPWYLEIAQDYVAAHRPTCGFSLDEAVLAQRVTIVGNEQGISADAARVLETAGCRVERIAGKDGTETRNLLGKLARNARPIWAAQTQRS
jgi:hypothetical protein